MSDDSTIQYEQEATLEDLRYQLQEIKQQLKQETLQRRKNRRHLSSMRQLNDADIQANKQLPSLFTRQDNVSNIQKKNDVDPNIEKWGMSQSPSQTSNLRRSQVMENQLEKANLLQTNMNGMMQNFFKYFEDEEDQIYNDDDMESRNHQEDRSVSIRGNQKMAKQSDTMNLKLMNYISSGQITIPQVRQDNETIQKVEKHRTNMYDLRYSIDTSRSQLLPQKIKSLHTRRDLYHSSSEQSLNSKVLEDPMMEAKHKVSRQSIGSKNGSRMMSLSPNVPKELTRTTPKSRESSAVPCPKSTKKYNQNYKNSGNNDYEADSDNTDCSKNLQLNPNKFEFALNERIQAKFFRTPQNAASIYVKDDLKKLQNSDQIVELKNELDTPFSASSEQQSIKKRRKPQEVHRMRFKTDFQMNDGLPEEALDTVSFNKTVQDSILDIRQASIKNGLETNTVDRQQHLHVHLRRDDSPSGECDAQKFKKLESLLFSLIKISDLLINQCFHLNQGKNEATKIHKMHKEEFNKFFDEFGDFECHLEQFNQLNERVVFFQDELLKREDQLTQNSQEMQQLWNHNYKLLDELNSKNNEFNMLNQKIEILEKKNDQLTKNMKNVSNAGNKQDNTLKEKLNDIPDSSKSDSESHDEDELNEQSQSLRTRTADDKLKRLNEKYTMSKRFNSYLQRDKKMMQEDIQYFEGKVTELEQQIKTKQDLIDTQGEYFKELDATLCQTELNNEELQVRVEELGQQLNEMTAKYEQGQAQLKNFGGQQNVYNPNVYLSDIMMSNKSKFDRSKKDRQMSRQVSSNSFANYSQHKGAAKSTLNSRKNSLIDLENYRPEQNYDARSLSQFEMYKSRADTDNQSQMDFSIKLKNNRRGHSQFYDVKSGISNNDQLSDQQSHQELNQEDGSNGLEKERECQTQLQIVPDSSFQQQNKKSGETNTDYPAKKVIKFNANELIIPRRKKNILNLPKPKRTSSSRNQSTIKSQRSLANTLESREKRQERWLKIMKKQISQIQTINDDKVVRTQFSLKYKVIKTPTIDKENSINSGFIKQSLLTPDKQKVSQAKIHSKTKIKQFKNTQFIANYRNREAPNTARTRAVPNIIRAESIVKKGGEDDENFADGTFNKKKKKHSSREQRKAANAMFNKHHQNIRTKSKNRNYTVRQSADFAIGNNFLSNDALPNIQINGPNWFKVRNMSLSDFSDDQKEKKEDRMDDRTKDTHSKIPKQVNISPSSKRYKLNSKQLQLFNIDTKPSAQDASKYRTNLEGKVSKYSLTSTLSNKNYNQIAMSYQSEPTFAKLVDQNQLTNTSKMFKPLKDEKEQHIVDVDSGQQQELQQQTNDDHMPQFGEEEQDKNCTIF